MVTFSEFSRFLSRIDWTILNRPVAELCPPPPPPPLFQFCDIFKKVILEDAGGLGPHIIVPPSQWIFWIRHCRFNNIFVKFNKFNTTVCRFRPIRCSLLSNQDKESNLRIDQYDWLDLLTEQISNFEIF